MANGTPARAARLTAGRGRIHRAPALQPMRVRCRENTRSSPFHVCTKGYESNYALKRHPHAYSTPIFFRKSLRGSMAAEQPRQPIGHSIAGRRPHEARRGWPHPLHPRCRWEQPRLAARPSTARAAEVRRRNNTRSEGRLRKVDPDRACSARSPSRRRPRQRVRRGGPHHGYRCKLH